MDEKINSTQKVQIHEVEYGILFKNSDDGKILSRLWFKLKDSDRIQIYKGIQTMILDDVYKDFEKIDNPSILSLFMVEHNNAILNMICHNGFWGMRDDFREAAFDSFLTISELQDE